ncbi:CLIP domain-containing serine protease B15-like isoform X1 [Ochlerotatus camptorhynchus]|uniref:CLIP domain-containing serine protease B15-like isoform X1 n=1 Tax=Ochlerotatus camptorhynchus TaxID=644619 RepID=UPI0031D823B6
MQKFMFSVLLSAWFLTIASVSSLVLNQSCTTPGGNHGRCVPVRSCKFSTEILRKNDFTAADQRYLESFRCGKLPGSGEVLTCCPRLHSEDNCGQLTMHDNILGGEETEPEEFPWMAMLGYKDNTGRIMYGCAGTLINERYVVTAAHCIINSRVQKLVEVRLGEWDMDTTKDCTTTRCFVDYQDDYPIEKIIVHEGYSSRQLNKEHDIALLKLSTAVERTALVAPICIPTLEMANSLKLVGESFDVSGWGKTENGFSSRRKMKVTLLGQNMTMCNAAFAEAGVTFTANQLCVGGLGGKDSCKGDSGGPLMAILENRWHLVGIVSVGAKMCGSEGIPAICTRLGSYLDWMVQKIELEGRVS